MGKRKLVMSSVVGLRSTAGGRWCWKRSRCMGDGGVSYWTSSSISIVDSVLFFFLRWIVLILHRLLSNCWTIKVCCQTDGISAGGGLLVASVAMEDSSPSGCLGHWDSHFSCLLVQGWVGWCRLRLRMFDHNGWPFGCRSRFWFRLKC